MSNDIQNGNSYNNCRNCERFVPLKNLPSSNKATEIRAEIFYVCTSLWCSKFYGSEFEIICSCSENILRCICRSFRFCMSETCVSLYLHFPTLVEYLVPTHACTRSLRVCTPSGAALCSRFACAVPALIPQERISDSIPHHKAETRLQVTVYKR